MGLFDRFARRPQPEAPGPAADPVMPAAGASLDEQAIARYRYLLRTAPPETIEQAHAEAFAQLTPEQRRKALAELGSELPAAERAAVERDGASAGALARAATRAELRRPGTMERAFGGMAAPGLGTMMAGTMLSSMAGMVLGSAIAHHFFQHDAGHGLESAAAGDAGATGDMTADLGGDTGGFDDGGFLDA